MNVNERTVYEIHEMKSFDGVICNKCNVEVSNKIVQLDFIQGKGILVYGLICQKCGTRYVVYVSDNDLRVSNIKAYELKYSIDVQVGKRDREYKEYMNKRGYIPMGVIDRWRKKIDSMRSEYIDLKTQNKIRGKKLKREYINRK